MYRIVTEIPATKQQSPPLRVAAYVRVSSEDDDQTMSFDTQVLYYSNLIRDTPD